MATTNLHKYKSTAAGGLSQSLVLTDNSSFGGYEDVGKQQLLKYLVMDGCEDILVRNTIEVTRNDAPNFFV